MKIVNILLDILAAVFVMLGFIAVSIAFYIAVIFLKFTILDVFIVAIICFFVLWRAYRYIG